MQLLSIAQPPKGGEEAFFKKHTFKFPKQKFGQFLELFNQSGFRSGPGYTMMRVDNYILENFADFMIPLILCPQQ